MHAYFSDCPLPDDPTLTSGIDAAYTYDHPLTTMPSEDRSDLGIFYPIMGHMCHMPVVEVDIRTGQVTFLDYVAVHDCGTMVNPVTLGGHVVGGTAQGIGTGALRAVSTTMTRASCSTASYRRLPHPDCARGAERTCASATSRRHRRYTELRHQRRRRRRPDGRASALYGSAIEGCIEVHSA